METGDHARSGAGDTGNLASIRGGVGNPETRLSDSTLARGTHTSQLLRELVGGLAWFNIVSRRVVQWLKRHQQKIDT